MTGTRLARRVAPAFAASAAVAFAACGSFKVALVSCPSVPRPLAATSATVSVRYLGVSGFLMRRGQDVILTAPMYSNPSLLEVGTDQAIRPDAVQIDRLLPADASEAKAILVGHSHYDHLLDVPYVALRKATRANIYGSETTVRLLASVRQALDGDTENTRIRALDGVAGDYNTEGHWIKLSPGLRFMALRSEHSPQVTVRIPFLDQPFPLHLWRGREESDLPRLPRSASEWPEGSVFSFVIDFTDPDGTPVFRVYFQDSGTNEPIGYPPKSLLEEKAVDLAILCVGGDFDRLERHPEGIVEWTRPRFVLLSHWEDFFVTQDTYEKDGYVYEIPPADQRKTARFLARAGKVLPPGAKLWLPCPSRSTFEFPLEPAETAR
jgi:hypothetical protein